MSLVQVSAHLGAASWLSALLGFRCMLNAGQGLHDNHVGEGEGRAAPDDNRLLGHRCINTCHAQFSEAVGSHHVLSTRLLQRLCKSLVAAAQHEPAF